jgi:hypothetical protein
VGFWAQRPRERQEAAGSCLKNYTRRGGCLLFARRNGWACLLILEMACQQGTKAFMPLVNQSAHTLQSSGPCSPYHRRPQ